MVTRVFLRRRLASIASAIAVGALVSGCVTLTGHPPRLFSIEEESSVVRARVVAAENTYYGSTVGRSEAIRNEIITSRIQAIDAYYYEYELALLREKQEVGFISSIVNIGMTGTIPLITSVGAKNILGGVSSGLQGANKAFNDEVLFQKTIQALQQQMRANRGLVAAKIIDRMNRLDIVAYPLPMALADLEEYYNAGTIAGALIEINRTVGEEARRAEAIKAESVFSIVFSPDAMTRLIEAYIRPGGRLDETRFNEAQALLRSFGSQRSIPFVLRDPSPESVTLRRRLASRLKLIP